jgi:acetylornithine deacetylase/succinyl-diaminopimelate desuccinylase-like protein
LLFIEVEGTIEGQSKEDQKNNTVLLYGHMDKQPPLTADWDEGLHPYTPVYRDGKVL